MEEISCVLNRLNKQDEKYLIDAIGKRADCASELKNTLQQMYNSHIVLTNNHTAAHYLALAAIDLKRGDKVMCSINSFPNIAQCIRFFDAEPIFVDIKQETFNIDPKCLEAALKQHKHKKLRALFLSHTAGCASDVDEIREICKAHSITLLHDGGFALGLRHKGELIGKKDLISSFGFNAMRSNPIFAGGFLVINNDEIFKRARMLNNNAISSSAFGEDGNLNTFYDVTDIGYEYALPQICAAVALSRIKSLESDIEKRRKIARIYDEKFANLKHIKTPLGSKEHTYTRYIIKIDKNRDNFAKKLKELKINTGIHYIPINFLSYYKQKYNLKITDFPNALANYTQILSIPIHSNMSKGDIERVCDAVIKLDSSWV